MSATPKTESQTPVQSLDLAKLLYSDIRLTERPVILEKINEAGDKTDHATFIRLASPMEAVSKDPFHTLHYELPLPESAIASLELHLQTGHSLTMMPLNPPKDEIIGAREALVDQAFLIHEIWSKIMGNPEGLEVRASIETKAAFWIGLGFEMREEKITQPQSLMYMLPETIQAWRERLANTLLKNFPNPLQPEPPSSSLPLPPPFPPPVLTPPKTPPPVVAPAASTPEPAPPVEKPAATAPKQPQQPCRPKKFSFLKMGFDILKALIWNPLTTFLSWIGGFFGFGKTVS